ncbi:MAG: Hint domain-containing protein [Planctomycetes bacterium]|nr:Hint domain-containing protein [Planctomycetota bacterium]
MRPLTDLEALLIKSAKGNAGHIVLDMADPMHYEFFLEEFGGRNRLSRRAPDILSLAQKHKRREIPPRVLSAGGLVSSETIRDVGIRQATEEGKDCFHVSGMPWATYVDNVPRLQIRSTIIDLDLERAIYDEGVTVDPDGNVFSALVSTKVGDKHYGLWHGYQTAARFWSVSEDDCGAPRFNGGLAVSIDYCSSTLTDIKKITLYHPTQVHLAERQNQQGNFDDYICVSYNRAWATKVPDYEYNVKIPHQTHMPVHIKFDIAVELRNDAFFYAPPGGTYLDDNQDPVITMSRFDTVEKKPMSGGEARLIVDWKQIKITTIPEIPEHEVTGLHLTFPEEWKCDLTQDGWLNTSTYSDFYARLSFNTKHKSPEEGKYFAMTTTVFVRFDTTIKNPSDPGECNVLVKRLFYQWGCLAGDTLLRTPEGSVLARDVRIGDTLLTRHDRAVVQDISTGMEATLLSLVTSVGTLHLTGDHAVLAQAGLKAARDLRQGDRVWAWDPETGEEILTGVEAIESVEYHDTVYNFQFHRESVIIANNLLVGDSALQQLMRGSSRPNYRVSNAGNQLRSQLNAVFDTPPVPPVFVCSDCPESLALHYFTIKALSTRDKLLLPEDAQDIAAYCQYLADNATTGSVFVDQVTADLSPVCRPVADGFEVPIIPSAMEKWYDNAELNKPKPRFSPDAADIRAEADDYDMIQDVLRPFHFPMGEKEKVVRFNSQWLQTYLHLVSEEARNQKGKLDQPVKQKIGLALHLLADSMLHERFSPVRDWRNLGRMQKVIDNEGWDITADYPPYREYDFKKLEDYEELPAGLQQIGPAFHASAVRCAYIFPLDESELPKNRDLIQYSGSKTRVNAERFTTAARSTMMFLCACRGKDFNQTDWEYLMDKKLLKLYSLAGTAFTDLETEWSQNFPSASFSYDAASLYERMVKGDETKETTPERYAEFFSFTTMLYKFKKDYYSATSGDDQ